MPPLLANELHVMSLRHGLHNVVVVGMCYVGPFQKVSKLLLSLKQR